MVTDRSFHDLRWAGAGALCLSLWLCVCAPVSGKDEKKTLTDLETKAGTKLIGDYTNFAGLAPITIEGVGLVVGLNGTGGNPAPSPQRTTLLEEMKRRQVPNPNAILASPDTALVIVRAYLPALLKKGETIDVEVLVPPSANCTSLEGGWLLETLLSEHAFIAGRGTLEGHTYAVAHGPILLEGRSPTTNEERRKRIGRILSGATVRRERELSIYLRNDVRSVRNSARIADAIGRRFYHFDQYGSQKPMAKAKTDAELVLDVHPRYKDNYARYLQVIRNIAFQETPVALRVRMEKLYHELLEPETAERASLQLEGIGNDAIPVLKAGLKSPLVECRFHAAMALAYLESSEAIPILSDVVRTEPAFRVFALAGLSTVEDAQSHLVLRELMSSSEPETRYGSFRALWTLDRKDPFITGEIMGLPPDDENGQPPEKSRIQPQRLWTLHPLQTQGTELVHCTLRTRPEVVVFGADQKFSTPLVLSAGRNILVTAQAGSDVCSVVKFQPGEADVREEVSLRVVDVLRAVDRMEASYPDVVQLLQQASEQKNLSGALASDALPESGRVYTRPTAESGKPGRSTKVGRDHQAPNLFPQFQGEEVNPRQDGDSGALLNVSPETDKSKSAESKRSLLRPWTWRKSEDVTTGAPARSSKKTSDGPAGNNEEPPVTTTSDEPTTGNKKPR
jgi:flagellar basal body P-ring protein FlgI